jgi:outer membrane receptor for ferrienterochelin and colicins
LSQAGKINFTFCKCYYSFCPFCDYVIMKKIILLLIIALNVSLAHSQNVFKAIVKDSAAGEFLTGAGGVLKGTSSGASVNANGELVISNISDGEQTIVFSYIGYKTLELKFSFPLSGTQIILLPHEAGEMDEVVVEGTRSNKSIIFLRAWRCSPKKLTRLARWTPSKIAHLIMHSTGRVPFQGFSDDNQAISGFDRSRNH